MSLNAAFNTAATGLTIALRAAGVTSENLANALTEGYARRDISIEPLRQGGARATNVIRHVDLRILSQARLATSAESGLSSTVSTLQEVDRLFGSTEDASSLFTAVTQLETALQSLASNPSEKPRQEEVAFASQNLAEKFRDISKGLQDIRQDADQGISSAVKSLNADLKKISKLNGSIAALQGVKTATLEDQRQALIDRVAAIIPVRQVARPHGAVALVTPKGQFLLDQGAYDLSFSTSGIMTRQKTVDNGQLETPKLANRALKLPETGRLAALINARDNLAPGLSAKLDDLADDLLSRTEAVQPEAPLFITGNPDNPSVSLGAAAVLPDAMAILEVLRNSGGAEPGTFADKTFALSTDISRQILHQEDALSAAQGSSLALQEAMNGSRVDTDTELQNLIRIEKIYAANAKALQAFDGMMEDLLSIG